MKVLTTGGAEFIGSDLADHLLAHGHDVRVLDALHPQVHATSKWPVHLASDVEAVFHFAARVDVGRSTYELAEYTSTNDVGTAVREGLARLLERARQAHGTPALASTTWG